MRGARLYPLFLEPVSRELSNMSPYQILDYVIKGRNAE